MRETKTEHKRILLLVKTQPTISKSYGELVCTAGIDKDGNWVRLYPFPFETYKSLMKKWPIGIKTNNDVCRKGGPSRAHEGKKVKKWA